ncbi:uncharacterized protein Z518_03263 [Rhinocladiella mackenziei CBS 650.93]|uniref:Uncharacterized protein n=1 Tax=Rhinocladiella mackenziei CBS 650.93 TaxID=1442369 RepID=A0A0D2G275_9EURO|nr:uncharacterized protein Z518_03263 [Rhinocladiella mackenziei CBS 650.93]KIX08607.1 hypothetical protein Z518_03263 [Rhinocladiella mackenziei CBS 650.93]
MALFDMQTGGRYNPFVAQRQSKSANISLRGLTTRLFKKYRIKVLRLAPGRQTDDEFTKEICCGTRRSGRFQVHLSKDPPRQLVTAPDPKSPTPSDSGDNVYLDDFVN